MSSGRAGASQHVRAGEGDGLGWVSRVSRVSRAAGLRDVVRTHRS